MKKLILLSAFTISFLTACNGAGSTPVDSTTSTPPGTLISYESASNYESDYLSTAVYNGMCPNDTDCTTNLANAAVDFNFHIESINTSTTNYVLHYSTPGVLAENREVTGGLIIPNIPKDQIKGIVLYYHETEVSKSDVPSCFHNSQISISYCSSKDPQTYGEELGGIIASEGYIVVMPDYVGLGFDNTVMHPYALYPQINALSGLYMLQAVNSALTKLDYQIQTRNLYITGFSEGGAYALWAAHILQNIAPNFLTAANLNLKAAIGMSGAYDLVNAQMPMEEDNISEGDKYNIANNDNATYAKPTLSSYTMASYGFYDLNQNYDPVFNTETGNGFYYCGACYAVFGSLYQLPELYIKNGLNDTDIKSAIYQSAILVSYGPQNANNSVNPLINTTILTDSNFIKTLESANIISWKTSIPVTLIELAQDSIVTNLNTKNAESGITAQSGANLVHKVTIENTRGSSRYMVINIDAITGQTSLMPLDHVGSSYYQLIAAINSISQYEDN